MPSARGALPQDAPRADTDQQKADRHKACRIRRAGRCRDCPWEKRPARQQPSYREWGVGFGGVSSCHISLHNHDERIHHAERPSPQGEAPVKSARCPVPAPVCHRSPTPPAVPYPRLSVVALAIHFLLQKSFLSYIALKSPGELWAREGLTNRVACEQVHSGLPCESHRG